MALGDHVLATIRYGVANRPLQLNVLWYTLSGAVGGGTAQDDAQTVADALRDAFDDPMNAVTTEETDLIGVHVAYTISGSTYIAVAPFLNETGSIPEDTLPEYCATVIQKRTASPGKSGRGRWYIGCVPETFADNSELTDAAIAAYAALKTQLVTGQTAGGCSLQACLHSAKLNTLTGITLANIVSFLGTERRRRVRPLLF